MKLRAIFYARMRRSRGAVLAQPVFMAQECLFQTPAAGLSKHRKGLYV